MQVKSFSPIQSGITYINPRASDFLGTQYFFNDSSEYLYCVIARKNCNDTTERYYLLTYLLLEGYNNGTDYDYRIDLDEFIYNIHENVSITDNTTFYSFVLPDNCCDFTIMFHGSDILDDATFISNVTTLDNGEMYIANADIGTCKGLVYSSFDLKVIDNTMSIADIHYVNDLYNNSYFMIGIGQNTTA